MGRTVLYLLPLLLVAPLELDALPPSGPEGPVAPAPALGVTVPMGGIRVAASITSRTKDSVTVEVRAENPTPAPAKARFTVQVVESPEVSPMARMVPIPRVRVSEIEAVALEPGQVRQHTLALSTGPLSRSARLRVRVIPAPTRQAQAQVRLRAGL